MSSPTRPAGRPSGHSIGQPAARSTASRKERERAERERLFLDVARRLFVERGYLGLTMDRVAEATEYSKGTLYQHFSCKEELIAALIVETTRVRAAWFERATAFRGRARERLAAIGETDALFVHTHPDHFAIETLIDAESINDKISPQLQEQRFGAEMRCTELLTGVVRDGVASGDLELPGGVTPETMVFGLWSMAFGSHVIDNACGEHLGEKGYGPVPEMTTRNFHALLDGYGFRPLLADWDYDATYARIRDELFGDLLDGDERDGAGR